MSLKTLQILSNPKREILPTLTLVLPQLEMQSWIMMYDGTYTYEYFELEDREQRKRKLLIPLSLGRNKELFKSSWQEKTQVIFRESRLTVVFDVWLIKGGKAETKLEGFSTQQDICYHPNKSKCWGNVWFSSYSNELISNRNHQKIDCWAI